MKHSYLATLIISLSLALHSSPTSTVDHSNDYFIMTAPGWDPGFFCCFQSVVGFLDFYEKTPCAGIKVKFERGLYYDPKIGPDWWAYFFEPIEIGNSQNTNLVFIGDGEKSAWCTAAISSISRETAAKLIQKYIKPKSHILEKINNFISKNFDSTYTIGIHYRGTDKSSEARRVPYSEVIATIKNFLRQHTLKSYKIFVASDEQAFVNYISSQFPSKVIYQDALRSSNGHPLHYNQINRYRQGEESVMDCYLLSRCHILIKTHSNLSSSSANINPNMPVISLSNRINLPNLRILSTQDQVCDD